MRRHPTACISLIALAVAPLALAGPIDDAVRGMDEGTVRFSYAVRPGVRGDGENIMINNTWESRTELLASGCDCDGGPARVSLEVREGTVRRLNACVGGTWRSRPDDDALDLGEVPPEEAAAFLLGLVRRARESVAEDAVFPAAVAEGVTVWPALIDVARDRDRPKEVRTSALFWVGQAAAEEATRGLESVVGDDGGEMDVREAAVFALSQRPSDEAVPALARVAKTSPHPELRETALFWLAQHDDPRVADLFEEILLGER